MSERRAENIWYKITRYKEFPILVKKYRKLAGIPTKGVPAEEWAEFLTKLSEENKIGNELPFHNFCFYPNAFIEEIKKKFTLTESLEGELKHYFFNNEFDAKDVNTTLCEIISTMKYGGIDIIFPWLKRLDKLREGVYIYVNPSSSVTMLKEFIEENKTLIEEGLGDAREKLGLGKLKRSRSFVKKDRDLDIYLLSLKNIKELKVLSGDTESTCKYKDLLIQDILKKRGIIISDGTIRTIISRQRQLSYAKSAL